MLIELRIEDTPSPPRHRRRRVVYVEDTDSDEDFDQKATQTGSNLIIEDTLIEVENVDEVCKRIKTMEVPLAFELRNEPWGDRHFAIVDPNGIGIDIVTYSQPTK